MANIKILAVESQDSLRPIEQLERLTWALLNSHTAVLGEEILCEGSTVASWIVYDCGGGPAESSEQLIAATLEWLKEN